MLLPFLKCVYLFTRTASQWLKLAFNSQFPCSFRVFMHQTVLTISFFPSSGFTKMKQRIEWIDPFAISIHSLVKSCQPKDNNKIENEINFQCRNCSNGPLFNWLVFMIVKPTVSFCLCAINIFGSMSRKTNSIEFSIWYQLQRVFSIGFCLQCIFVLRNETFVCCCWFCVNRYAE